ncbi:MAG TPA: membrane dipeptidase [Pyrinomonadaceae bacterium]|jgi:membrane dipeptidase|nr:membrane dipeptidase [Pyrinomonadaceae bacterium]
MNQTKSFLRSTLALLLLAACAADALPQSKETTKAAPVTDTLPASGDIQRARDERLWQKTLKLQRSAIVVDTHNDILSIMFDENYDLGQSSVGKYHTDLARMKEGGLSAEFFSVYVDRSYAKGGAARRAMDLIDMVYRAAEKYPNDLMMSYTSADIRRAKKQKKIAALMGIEGGHAIENSLMALRDFYRLGVRYMTLTHNNTNDWADACCDASRHNGLSDFGKEVVREMNRIGMLVDISHVSDKTMSDVLDISTAPVIASHSSARALAARPRNIPDDLLRRIAKNGGVVMINFYPVFIDQKAIDASEARNVRLKPQRDALSERYKNDPKRLEEELTKLNDANPLPPTPLSVLVDHFDHVARVAGIDHVGIGSDFDGVPYLPEGMKDIAQLPNLTYELLRRGYSERDVRKVLGENFLRAFAEAERVASRASGGQVSRAGSVRRIEEGKK